MRAALRKSIVGMGRLIPRRRTMRSVVLCYHSIHPDGPFASASPALFDQHLEWLAEMCEVVPFESIWTNSARQRRDRPKVAITFDDGYADNYEHAYPLLKRHGFPATFFVTAGFLERDPSVLQRFQSLRGGIGYEHIRPLDWEQTSEMRQQGMSIGSHTYSHPNLARISIAEAEDELRRSKDILEDRLNVPITTLAFPFGKPRRHINEEVIQLAERHGYQRAAAVLFRGVRRSDSPLSIPRFFVAQDDVATLAAKVRGDWDLYGAWQERAPLWAARRVAPEDFRY